MTQRIRIGLAGAGRMGQIHAASLSARCPTAELACVFDADADRGRRVAERFEVPWARSYDGMLADGAIDAVVIATPTGTHAELSIRASRAGKHIFCEKPVSLDRQAALDAIAAAEAAGVTFQVGFHRRFDPDWAAATERIRAGGLGEVYLFRTSLRDMTPPDPAFLSGSDTPAAGDRGGRGAPAAGSPDRPGGPGHGGHPASVRRGRERPGPAPPDRDDRALHRPPGGREDPQRPHPGGHDPRYHGRLGAG
jgi:predicted dehydrogenase